MEMIAESGNDNIGLRPLKDRLGDDFNYGEIRLVMEYNKLLK